MDLINEMSGEIVTAKTTYNKIKYNININIKYIYSIESLIEPKDMRKKNYSYEELIFYIKKIINQYPGKFSEDIPSRFSPHWNKVSNWYGN